MKTRIIILLLILTSFQSEAQTIFHPSSSFKVDLGLPSGFANKPFKTIMQGLIEIAPYYQYTTKFGLSFGAGLKYNYFTINQFKLPLSTKGGMSFVGGFGKIGYEKFISDKFAIDAGIRIGYNEILSKNSGMPSGRSYDFGAAIVQPTVGFYLMVDENSGFSFNIGYSFIGMKFGATALQLDEIDGFSPSQFKKITQVFTVGFGYSYYFTGKK